MDSRLHLAPDGGEQGEPRRESADATLQACVASVPEPLLILDDKAVILIANEAAAQVFGHGAQALVGLSFGDLLPESIRHHHETLLRRRFARGIDAAPRVMEIPGLHANGR